MGCAIYSSGSKLPLTLDMDLRWQIKYVRKIVVIFSVSEEIGD
jgi:hypothetical protein